MSAGDHESQKASIPLFLGIPVGTIVGLGIGSIVGDPLIGAAIGTPIGLFCGLIVTIFLEQRRKRRKK